MADIFLSYARDDSARARALALALEQLGWSVFWDVHVPAGSTWENYLEAKLAEARSVVVAWSAKAVVSEWVKEEAREGKERKILIPVFFEKVAPPFGYKGIQGVSLSEWTGDVGAPEFRKLAFDLLPILGGSPQDLGKAIDRLAGRAAAKATRSLAAKKGWERRRRRTKEQPGKAQSKTPSTKRPAGGNDRLLGVAEMYIQDAAAGMKLSGRRRGNAMAEVSAAIRKESSRVKEALWVAVQGRADEGARTVRNILVHSGYSRSRKGQ